MDAEQTIFSVFYLSFFLINVYFQMRAGFVRGDLMRQYGIPHWKLNAFKLLDDAMTPEEKAELYPRERRATRFLLWGLLVVVIITATYGLTKAALEK